VSFSAAAWKCGVRDRWIGWDFRHHYDPPEAPGQQRSVPDPAGWHRSNLGSKTLALCQRRLPGDWRERFGHPLVLLETFVDPECFQGTVYRTAKWAYWARREDFAAPERAIAPPPDRLRRCSSNPCRPMHGRGSPHPSSHSPIVGEYTQDHADCRTDEGLTRVLCRSPRSAPRPGATPSAAGGSGHRRRSDPVRHAQLQGHRARRSAYKGALWWLSSLRDSVPLCDGARPAGVSGAVIDPSRQP
jgi:hypothetical protein